MTTGVQEATTSQGLFLFGIEAAQLVEDDPAQHNGVKRTVLPPDDFTARSDEHGVRNRAGVGLIEIFHQSVRGCLGVDVIIRRPILRFQSFLDTCRHARVLLLQEFQCLSLIFRVIQADRVL